MGSIGAEHLFEGLYIFQVPPTGVAKPELVEAHPSLDTYSVVPEDKLVLFCFPYDPSHPIGIQRQCFTFSLTTADSTVYYGYCLQEQPATPGSPAVLFCILSKLSWHVFFRRLLGFIAGAYDVERGFGGSSFTEALRRADGVSLVAPLAQTLAITLPNNKPVLVTTPDCRRPPVLSALPLIDVLISRLSAPNILQIFASLLAERRVILTSSSLSMLTDCVHAFSLLLFPFTWQHVFIPAVPLSLVDYCCATLPFLIGAHASVMAAVSKLPLEQHVFVNLDTNEVDTPFNDMNILPAQYVTEASSIIRKLRSRKRGSVETFVECTLELFVDSLLGYAIHIKHERTPTIDAERFAVAKPRSISTFLQLLCSTQMFAQFLLADPRAAGDRHSIVFGSAADNRALFDEYVQAAATRIPLLRSRRRLRGPRTDRVVRRIKRVAKSVRIKSRSPASDPRGQEDHTPSPAPSPMLPTSMSFTHLTRALEDPGPFASQLPDDEDDGDEDEGAGDAVGSRGGVASGRGEMMQRPQTLMEEASSSPRRVRSGGIADGVSGGSGWTPTPPPRRSRRGRGGGRDVGSADARAKQHGDQQQRRRQQEQGRQQQQQQGQEQAPPPRPPPPRRGLSSSVRK